MNKKDVHILEQPVAEVKSAVRVLELFELLVEAREPLGVSEIARTLQMPKSSTYMLLATVEGRGYIVDKGGRRFMLHPALHGTGKHWVGGFRGALLRASRPVMRRLAEFTGESVFLAVLRADEHVEYVEKVVSAHDLRVDARLGTPRLLHATSSGLVLLAWNDAVREDYLKQRSYPQLTPYTIATADELRRALDRVRTQGYAMVRDTNSAHASGISAPLWDMYGTVVAALTLAAPTSRFDADTIAAGRDALLRSAKEVSSALGFESNEHADLPTITERPHE